MASTKCLIPAKTLNLISHIDEMYRERITKGDASLEKTLHQRTNL